MSEHTKGNSYNIAGGVKTTIHDMVDVAIKEFNLAVTPRWSSMPRRNWDLTDWYGNPEKANNELGWKARTDVRSGLRKTFEWQETIDYDRVVIPAFEEPLLNPVITAVIACYRDAQAIPAMYDRLVKMFDNIKVRYEIIF